LSLDQQNLYTLFKKIIEDSREMETQEILEWARARSYFWLSGDNCYYERRQGYCKLLETKERASRQRFCLISKDPCISDSCVALTYEGRSDLVSTEFFIQCTSSSSGPTVKISFQPPRQYSRNDYCMTGCDHGRATNIHGHSRTHISIVIDRFRPTSILPRDVASSLFAARILLMSRGYRHNLQKEKKMSGYQPIPLLEPEGSRFYTLTSGYVGGGYGSVKPLDHETRNPASGVPSDWSFVEISSRCFH
jgi:hypothetical protein